MTTRADVAELATIARFAARGDLSRLALQVEASILADDFAEFVRHAWPVLEPGTSMRWGWALEAMTDHLVAVTDGQIKRLLMNVPPGMMKSLMVGVFWPAWEWTNPALRHYRYLGTAHKQDLAVRDNMKCRRLIQSDWYQRRWPDVVLTGDQNAKTKFENTATGFREAMAFQSMTGSRGDRVILDDPLSVDAANSVAELNAAEVTFTEALPTRVNNDESAIIVVMQRLAEKDTSGIILSRKLPYTHLMLPMEYEPERKCMTSLGFSDPRKKLGELLFPERFGPKQVAELKTTLGAFATAGQLQQRPSPRGGGMFRDEHLQLWPRTADLPDLTYVLQSYDTAFTEKTASDDSACTVWAIFVHPKRRVNCILLVDAWNDKLAYPKLRKKVVDDWSATYGGKKLKSGHDDPAAPPRRADALLVEDKGSGISILQDLRAANVPALSYNPGRADKYTRASAALPIYEMGLVYVLESSKEPGKPVAWARAFTEQLGKFGPGVAGHDDYVDTFTQAVIFLRDSHLLTLPAHEEPEAELPYRTVKRNPYD